MIMLQPSQRRNILQLISCDYAKYNTSFRIMIMYVLLNNKYWNTTWLRYLYFGKIK